MSENDRVVRREEYVSIVIAVLKNPREAAIQFSRTRSSSFGSVPLKRRSNTAFGSHSLALGVDSLRHDRLAEYAHESDRILLEHRRLFRHQLAPAEHESVEALGLLET